MKYYSIFLISILIILAQAPIPNWDLQNQSISLPDYEQIIYEKSNVILRKVIKMDNGILSNKNMLNVGNNGEREVQFEDIESHYDGSKHGFGTLICPKGNFYPYDYTNNRNVTPTGYFKIYNSWDLTCYEHDTNSLLIFFSPNKEFFLF